MRRRNRPTVEEMGRVSVADIATELALPVAVVARILADHGWWIGDGRRIQIRRRTTAVTYEARVIDVLRGLLGQEHRQIEEPANDWLTQYLNGAR